MFCTVSNCMQKNLVYHPATCCCKGFVCLWFFVSLFFFTMTLLQTMLIEIHCIQFECLCILSITYILHWVLFPGFLFLFFIFYAFSHPSLILQFIFPCNRELDSVASTECSKLWTISWTKCTCGEQHEAFSVAVYLWITCTVIPVSKHVNPAWAVDYEVLPLDSQAILKVILEACNLCQEREKFGGNSVSLSCNFYCEMKVLI